MAPRDSRRSHGSASRTRSPPPHPRRARALRRHRTGFGSVGCRRCVRRSVCSTARVADRMAERTGGGAPTEGRTSMEAKKPETMADALARVAPGTPLREGLDSIVAGKTGALIVVGEQVRVASLCDGGFTLDTPFTPQRLFQLAKTDGAIVLDANIRTILRANVHLQPDSRLPATETGMRHRTAERVARQTGALVISVSQRRDIVTLCLLYTSPSPRD